MTDKDIRARRLFNPFFAVGPVLVILLWLMCAVLLSSCGLGDGQGKVAVPEGALSSRPSGAAAGCPGTVEEMVQALNHARATGRMCGSRYFPAAPPVTWDRRLAAAACRHSQDMASGAFMSHTGSDGSSVRQRVEATGYRAWTWGENVAYGQKDVEEVVSAWLGSPGHCENIMTPEFRQVGACCALGPESNGFIVKYWTLVLAGPKD